uniref:Putative lipocalin n=1 Tax=Rhipicephalus microplus TaxID=6941 RepID=A0A6G5A4M6_RHIMP
MFVLFLPCLVRLASGGSSQPEIPSNLTNATWPNLLEFLGTSEEIWLKHSSESTGETDCYRWEKRNLTNTTYDYFNWYRKGSQKKIIRNVRNFSTNQRHRE